jgi:uncharacterized protein (TIGR00730 family)
MCSTVSYFAAMEIKSVAVFCGSKSGNDPLYETHARDLGALIGKAGQALVYGGGNKGLMAAVANAALEHGAYVTGIIPEVLRQWEHQHEGLSKLHIVDDMHVRKRMMYDLCDAAIILPGGFGTLDELFEMLTWNTLNIHNKKIYILNTAGFYRHLLQHASYMLTAGFLYEDWQNRIKLYDTPDAIYSDWNAGKY